MIFFVVSVLFVLGCLMIGFSKTVFHGIIGLIMMLSATTIKILMSIQDSNFAEMKIRRGAIPMGTTARLHHP